MRELGYGKGYQYAHDFEEHIADIEYLPDALRGRRYYEPTDIGYEAVIREYLEKVKNKKRRMG
jgi:putative ATPase